MNTRTPPKARTLPFHRALARSHALGLLQEAQMHGIDIRLHSDELVIDAPEDAEQGLLFRIGAAKAGMVDMLKNTAEVFDFEAERRERLPRIKRERMRRECAEVGRRMGWQLPPRPRPKWPFDDGPPGGNAA